MLEVTQRIRRRFEAVILLYLVDPLIYAYLTLQIFKGSIVMNTITRSVPDLKVLLFLFMIIEDF
jgi:hypothetical protein